MLADLATYVRWTIPDPAAVPVFRAYDLGCEFDASHVQQMYGADMRVRLRDDNGQPALDPSGAELVFDNAWEEAPTPTLTTSELAWLSRLDACTGAVEWTALAGDDQLRTQVPGLLFDDFSGDLANRWTALVLDPDEPRAANWHPSGGVLLQDVAVAGGDASASSPDKPGTVYLSGEADAADFAVETVAWAASGAYGLVFRWTDPQSYYRFSLEPRRSRLVKVDAGAVEELWSSRDGYVANAPTRLAVQAEGTRIRCQVDERLVCDLEDGDPAAPASGAVGLYTWDSATAAFDEVRARPWPGNALAPARGHLAELEASRPLFTDAFDDLGAFEVQFLDSGSPSGGGSAGGGTATITAPRSGRMVGALAGDPEAGDYLVECNARPAGRGRFGLVARHGGPDSYLSLELEPGVGRKLLARLGGSGIIVPVRVLWQDEGLVEMGRGYALALRCEGDTIAVSVDGEEHTAILPGGLPARGRFGLFWRSPLPAAPSPTWWCGPRHGRWSTTGASPPRATWACRTCSTASWGRVATSGGGARPGSPRRRGRHRGGHTGGGPPRPRWRPGGARRRGRCGRRGRTGGAP